MTDDDALIAFLAERNRALETLDLGWARKQIPNQNDEVLLLALHKARYECKAIADDLRRESRAWLAARDYQGLTGPLLPDGQLPT